MEIVVGRVGRAHGIRGEVRVEARTDDVERRFTVGAVLRPEHGDRRVVTIRTARSHGGALLIHFDEVADRTAAEAMRGVLLYADVPEDERPDDDEEYYDRQLVGLRARTPGGSDIGDVVDVLHLPGQEVLVVSKLNGDEALVPFVRDFVPLVDLDAATVTIDDRPGLLEET